VAIINRFTKETDLQDRHRRTVRCNRKIISRTKRTICFCRVHRRSQDFLRGVHFFYKTLVTFLVVLLNIHSLKSSKLTDPTLQPSHVQQKFPLKIDFLLCLGNALTNFVSLWGCTCTSWLRLCQSS